MSKKIIIIAGPNGAGKGGHDIPEAVIRRRFVAGLRNLDQTYKSAVDTWATYDNVGERPSLLEWGENE